MLILILAAGLGFADHTLFSAFFMEYAVNVCEDSAIKEINTLMEDEVFLPSGRICRPCGA